MKNFMFIVVIYAILGLCCNKCFAKSNIVSLQYMPAHYIKTNPPILLEWNKPYMEMQNNKIATEKNMLMGGIGDNWYHWDYRDIFKNYAIQCECIKQINTNKRKYCEGYNFTITNNQTQKTLQLNKRR